MQRNEKGKEGGGVIIFESVMSSPYINKKPSLPSHRTLHSHKKLVDSRANPSANSHQGLKAADRKAFLDFIPSDEGLIEEYIQQLRQKLQEIRGSPKRKPPRMETEQIFKRKASEPSGTKSKPRSNQTSRGKVLAEQYPFQTAKKSALLDLKQARDQFKRSKQGLAERRVTTEKENNRYSQEKPIRTQSKTPQGITQSCDLRARSNTEVLRSQKNPARIYRYSSLKKAPCVEQGAVSNHFLFDKLISVHHNINIHLDDAHPYSPTKERLRREPNEEPSHEKKEKITEKRDSKSPKKTADKIAPEGEKGEKGEKIGDLSTINARKETLNFLGESCLGLRDQLAPKEEKEVSKILDFLGWKTNEMHKALSNAKQKKRKNCLDKLGKIFPKGFFP